MSKMIRTQYMMNTMVVTPIGKAMTTGWGIESEKLIEVRLCKNGTVHVMNDDFVVPYPGQTIKLPDAAMRS